MAKYVRLLLHKEISKTKVQRKTRSRGRKKASICGARTRGDGDAPNHGDPEQLVIRAACVSACSFTLKAHLIVCSALLDLLVLCCAPLCCTHSLRGMWESWTFAHSYDCSEP